LRRDGRPLPGFPVEPNLSARPGQDPEHILDVGFFSAPVLADLDGDRRPEIIIGGFDGKLYAWHASGQLVRGFPVDLTDPATRPAAGTDVAAQRIMSTAAVGDLDQDGRPDIVIASTEHYSGSGRIYAVHGDGNAHAGGPFLPGWPVRNIVTADVLPVV